jgi:hypothetical protein
MLSETYLFHPKKVTLIVEYENGESWEMECDDPIDITVEVDQDGYDTMDGFGTYIKHMITERWVTTKWRLPHKKSGEKYFTLTRRKAS